MGDSGNLVHGTMSLSMRFVRIAALAAVLVSLAVWFSSATATRGSILTLDPDEPGLSAKEQESLLVSEHPGIELQLERLSREVTDNPPVSGRNPFVFVATSAVVSGETSRTTSGPATVSVVVPPRGSTLSLAGIAGEQTSVGMVHIGILAADDGVVLVRVGDEILGRYRVDLVGSDRVELFDHQEDKSLFLTLR